MLLFVQNGWPRNVEAQFKPYWTQREVLSIEAGCLLRGIQAVIPRKLRSNLLAELHVDHPGMSKMKAVARGYFWCLDWIERLAKK